MSDDQHPDVKIPIEIERKFRVTDNGWQQNAQATPMRQGYLARTQKSVVRVRIAGATPWLTIKTKGPGITSPEFEYEIPLPHAEYLLTQCEGAIIEKTRYVVHHDGDTWEVDVFEGVNAGLVIAEIELESEEQAFTRPPWLGKEVTEDRRFKNSRLCEEPYRDDWTE
ncbi:MAG: adenylate cyclase [Myxococcota bacterium]|jgi:adenylate cyclase